MKTGHDVHIKIFWRIMLIKDIKPKFIKRIFFYISFIYITYVFFENFGQLSLVNDLYDYKLNIVLSIGFCFLSILLNAIAWKNIIIWFGHSSISKDIIPLFISTNVLKYIPGSIWHFIERFNFLKQKSNQVLAFYATIIEPYFMLSAALLMASLGVIYYFPLIFLIIPSIFLNRSLIYFTLRKLDFIKNKSIRLLNLPVSKNEFDSIIKIKTIFPWPAFISEVAFILFKFFGFISCFFIFNSYEPSKILLVFVVFCFSWSVGLVIPAAPGGTVVFEACFLLVLKNYYPEEAILVSVVIFRLISTFVDALISAPFLIKRYLKN